MFALILLALGFMYQDTLIVENWEGDSFPDWHFVDYNSDGCAWEVGTTNRLDDYNPPNYGTKYVFYNDFDAGKDSPETEERICSNPLSIDEYSGYLFVYYEFGFRERVNEAVGFYVDWHLPVSDIWKETGPHAWYDSDTSCCELIDLSDFLIQRGPDGWDMPDSLKVYWIYYDYGNRGWAVAIDSIFIMTKLVCPGIDEDGIDNEYGIKSLYFGQREIEMKINRIRDETDVDVFDLSGRKIEKFERGIYFIRIRDRSYKIVIL